MEHTTTPGCDCSPDHPGILWPWGSAGEYPPALPYVERCDSCRRYDSDDDAADALELGYSVDYRPLAKGHGGTCDPAARALTINSELSVNAQVSVLCHELAHALVRHDHHDDDPQLSYAAEELAAESVAHLAVSFVGLDSSAAAVPYLASWAESAPADTFTRIAGLVDRLAARLEQALGADEDAGADSGAAAAAAA